MRSSTKVLYQVSELESDPLPPGFRIRRLGTAQGGRGVGVLRLRLHVLQRRAVVQCQGDMRPPQVMSRDMADARALQRDLQHPHDTAGPYRLVHSELSITPGGHRGENLLICATLLSSQRLKRPFRHIRRFRRTWGLWQRTGRQYCEVAAVSASAISRRVIATANPKQSQLDTQLSSVTTVSVQDEADSVHIRLTPAQVAALMMRPDLCRPRGRRDVALIALFLATGLREGEVAQLEIDDLYQTYGGVPVLRVKAGKRAQAYKAPFGDMLWARQITEL